MVRVWVLLVLLATSVPGDEAQAELTDDAAQHGSFHPPLAIRTDGVYICHLPSSCAVARPSLVRDAVNAEVRIALFGVVPSFSYQVVAEIPAEGSGSRSMQMVCRGHNNMTIPQGEACCLRHSSRVLRVLWSAVLKLSQRLIGCRIGRRPLCRCSHGALSP